MTRCSAIFSSGETSGALRSAKPLLWRELRARFCYGEREKHLKKEAKLQLGVKIGRVPPYEHPSKMSIPPKKPLNPKESATRPLRAHLAPVSGFAPVHANNRRHSGERAGNGLQSPRSLEPERLPPPPEMSRHNILAPLSIVVASILVATIAYYFAVGGWVPPSEPAPGPQTRSFDPTVIAPLSWSTGQQASWPTTAQDNDLATSEQSEIATQRTKTSQPARSSEGKTMAMVQPGEPGAQIPPASKATRVLDPEEIKLLMKQGQQFIAAGDVVTARNVFQRAAEVGDADAVVALGGTYDPIAFAKLGVAGLRADVEKARTWYQKAESLGSAEATRRLAILGNHNFTPMRYPMR